MTTQPKQIVNSAATFSGSTTARKSWFSGNRKWFVPTLVMFGFVLPLALCAGAILSVMRNSDVAKQSLLRARSNPLLVKSLGTPIEEGWLVSGSINISTTSGDADLAVPISGPKGKGKIYVTAQERAGAWSYSVMEAAIEGSDQRINLLSGNAAAPPAQVASDAGSAAATLPAQPTSAVDQPTPAAEPPTEATAALPAVEQAGVIQTQETNSGGMVAELTECRRHEGVLTIKLRFRNTSNKRASLQLTAWNAHGDFEKFYVTAGSKKYFILKDTEGVYLSSLSASNGVTLQLDPGQTSLWWAKYPAPSPDVKKINLIIPVAPPFEDIPITVK